MPTIEHKLNITEEEVPEHIRRLAQEQGECPSSKDQIIEQFRTYILGGHYPS